MAGECEKLAVDLSGLEAGSADIKPFWRGAYEGANSLNVRIPTATGTSVRVRNAVAEAWALATDLTVGRHGRTPKYQLVLDSALIKQSERLPD